jgi:hypothetical protein
MPWDPRPELVKLLLQEVLHRTPAARRVESESTDTRQILALMMAQQIDEIIAQNARWSVNPKRINGCDEISAITAVVFYRIGFDPVICRGKFMDTPHAWVRLEGFDVDLAAEQFGLSRVHMFPSGTDDRYHSVTEVLSEEALPCFLHLEDIDIVKESVARFERIAGC